MSITIRDVAQAAGVSTATVSRALRGLAHVDPETREKVLRVAQELDYVISPSASRLASGRTGTIAVVTPFIARWFFATVLSGISEVLQDRGIDLLVVAAGDPQAADSVRAERRLRGRVDGIVVVALPTHVPGVQEILGLGLPVAFVGARAPGVPSVSIDDERAGRLATQHLINTGHTRIGLIAGDESPVPGGAADTRARGFRATMTEAGLTADESLVAHGHFTILGGESAMTTLLSQPQPPTAVLAMSDEMAFGAIRALQRQGLRPGVDVAVVGIDGHELSVLLELTTVVQPVADMGRMAAEALMDLIAGNASADDVRVPTQLIVRGSTVPLERKLPVV